MSKLRYRLKQERIGRLDCVVVQPQEDVDIEKVAVFCHGFGAPGNDLVGIAQELLGEVDESSAMAMIFPAAPLSLADQGMPGARAWWLLSIARLMAAMESGDFAQIRAEVPDGIDTARAMLTEMIETALTQLKLSEKQLLLGGFSQGAMLSMDVACRGLKQPPAALCLYSGALICEQHWRSTAQRLDQCTIFQSHGRQDQILPFIAGKWLCELLREAGCDVNFQPFDGPHTISLEAIQATGAMLSAL